MRKKPLSQRKNAALAFITHKQRAAGPTLRELGNALGVSAMAAHRYVAALRADGSIRKDTGDGLVLK